MSNKKFYYICNLATKTAIDYRQLPEVYGPISGINDSSDEDIADLTWAGISDIGFLSEAAAIAQDISVESIAAAKLLGAAAIRVADKLNREALVEAIVVTTTSGKNFNGDEESQNRMARAILGLQAASATEIIWVLSDNTAKTVTSAELGEALALSGAAQAAVWVI